MLLVRCPRCSGNVFNIDEPTCVQCGWHEWREPEKVSGKALNGNVQIIRYVGNSLFLKDITVQVRTSMSNGDRSKEIAKLDVACPFCSRLMRETPVSGVRIYKDVRRYLCRCKMRVFLTSDLSSWW